MEFLLKIGNNFNNLISNRHRKYTILLANEENIDRNNGNCYFIQSECPNYLHFNK